MSFSGPPLRWQALRKTGHIVGLAAVMLATGSVEARERALTSVAVTHLPTEAQGTYRAIFAGGPFPYQKDGTVFGNRERMLPARPRGFYHEYTVRTPAAHDRGAQRIVCGGTARTRPEACFYTNDHYATFRRIASGGE